MSNNKTRAAIMELPDGEWISVPFKSDSLKSLVAHLEGERDRWRLALESLTPMGSEFVNDLDRCLNYIIEQRGIEHRRAVDAVIARKRAEGERDELKAKVEAMDKMLIETWSIAVDGNYVLTQDSAQRWRINRANALGTLSRLGEQEFPTALDAFNAIRGEE